ncbi:hypothetical protein PybrP1_010720 [[Pythium] brassicae (nom. inval.)]|nr:hypothetical protein PybrP1_010720 [[Pythium] brassicae (nom. inval.)]
MPPELLQATSKKMAPVAAPPTRPARRAKITSEETRCAHADVIGDEALRGKLLGSGPILHKIDQLVAEICDVISRGPVVTVAFDAFKLLRPVFHGDFIRLEGRAISIGNSSMVCQVSVYRQDFPTGKFQLTHNAVATFVALDAGGQASGGLPTLYDPLRPAECEQLQALARKRKGVSAHWTAAQEEIDRLQRVTPSMVPKHKYEGGRKAIGIHTTVVETRHTFLFKHANLQRNVFGGVLLEWMLPIQLHHLISIRARVCRVQKYSVEVEIAVYRYTGDADSLELSHTGYFDVLNIEEDNRKREIHVDVTAAEDDLDGLRALLKAHKRQLFEKEDAELLEMAPIPLSAPTSFVPSLTARI